MTNAQFASFVEDTGYRTDAERLGWSFVFHSQLGHDNGELAVLGLEWWRRVEAACWKAPYGPDSSICDLAEHPVVHVSWHDAVAFARWAGGRLPSEAEWEHAARGGLDDPIYPWGDRHPDDQDFMPCNIWQGRFPDVDTGADGFSGLAPAHSFEPNGFGLFNMVGNCWEWTAQNFRIRTNPYRAGGPRPKLLKGGSFLCHRSYCHRYRIAARSGNTADSTSNHVGFRIAFDS